MKYYNRGNGTHFYTVYSWEVNTNSRNNELLLNSMTLQVQYLLLVTFAMCFKKTSAPPHKHYLELHLINSIEG